MMEVFLHVALCCVVEVDRRCRVAYCLYHEVRKFVELPTGKNRASLVAVD